MNCGIMGLVTGKALGLPEVTVTDLAVGCALLDIGKTRVPPELLNKPYAMELTARDRYLLRQHVAHGVELVGQGLGTNRQLKEMLATHHERYDGKGYPDGIEGAEIPSSGAIAGIFDLFDAMVSQRQYGRRATPNEAIRYVKQQRGKDFSPEVTDQFVQIFRPYPTGSLVELSDGSVGRVLQQHEKALLAPRVHLVLDADGQRINEFRVLVLQPAVGDEDALCIRQCLKPGTYGID